MNINERVRIQWMRLFEFFGLAVLIHLAIIPLLAVFIPEAPPKGASKKVRVVSLVSRGSLSQRKQSKLKPEQHKEKKKEKKKEEPVLEKLKGTVVDLPPSLDSTPPEEADFLSEHNTKTERQTISRHRRLDYKNAMNELSKAELKKSSPKPQMKVKALEIGPKKPSKNKRDQEAKGKATAFEIPKLKQRDRLALRVDPNSRILQNKAQTKTLLGNSDRLKLSAGEKTELPKNISSAPEKGQTSIDLMPEVGVLAKLSGAPPSDVVDDSIEEGEGTFLNSREFKYASFFNRLKRGISQHWRPLMEYRRRDPTGNIYGQRSRVTVLDITLKADGSLFGVEVTHSSGVDFLDREAVQAFRRAQPFPNPPKGLVNKKGYIKFPFGFHIEFSRSGGLRLPF